MANPSPPFVYYGGKRRMVETVWSRLGAPKRYIEPFCGGLAMLLGRPEEKRNDNDVEIINDKDGFVVNLWRAIQFDPAGVADRLDRPGAELDIHAASKYLRDRKETLSEQLQSDLKFYDAELAALWLWGRCFWIGGGWPNSAERRPRSKPDGILSPTHRDKRRRWLEDLSDRLSKVTILCGDWQRCVTSDSAREGRSGETPVAFFFDPPYGHEHRTEEVFPHDAKETFDNCREWCVEYGKNHDYRIALCGSEKLEMPDRWEAVTWNGNGTDSGRQRERIWFSPGCLNEEVAPLLDWNFDE